MRVIHSVDALRKGQRDDIAIHDLCSCWRVESNIVGSRRGVREWRVRHPAKCEVELWNDERVRIAVASHLCRTLRKTQRRKKEHWASRIAEGIESSRTQFESHCLPPQFWKIES